VYRISYAVSGELPKISLVKDEKLTNNLVDIGTDIEEIGVSEFLSMFTPFIYPKHIESKGDYLFAANLNYSQDEVDKWLEDFDFDTRAYSLGSYKGNVPVIQPDSNGNVTIQDGDLDITQEQLRHLAFDETSNLYLVYNPSDWDEFTVNNDSNHIYNGYGKYICWKYDLRDIDDKIHFTASD